MRFEIPAALLVLTLLVVGCKQPSSTNPPSPISSSPSPTPSDSVLIRANYDKIKTGMTLAEVEKVLGKGKEQTSNEFEFAGKKTVTIAYIWSDRGKTITVVVQNDKVTSKAQIGLE
jgi:hypothetical protein